jgi:hypothetical protein
VSVSDSSFILAILGAAVFAGLIIWWSRHARHGSPRTQPRASASPQVERDFRNVFAMTSPAAKEAILEKWMRREGCDRSEAMRRAVEEWRRDNR